MNYSDFTDLADATLHSHDEEVGALYSTNRVTAVFGIAQSKMRSRLRASENHMTDDGSDLGAVLVTAPGLFKLLFAGTSLEAERFRVWVAGEVVPLIFINGGYRGLAGQFDDQPRIAWEKSGLLALRVAASAYAALAGDAPEDRDFQDYLAEIVLPAVLEGGAFVTDVSSDVGTAAFEALAELR